MKKFTMLILTILLGIMLVIPVSASPSLLVDDADLLTDAEESELSALLIDLSTTYAFDIVVVTTDSLNGESAQDYADDYFDYNGYGQGELCDGSLFLVSMDEREWHISTCGYGIRAISDHDLMEIEDAVVPYLSAEDYASAFKSYANMTAAYVDEAIAEGVSREFEGLGWGFTIIASLLIGFVFAFIPMSIMKSKMKSVRSKVEATDYVDRKSQKITFSRDAFLYSTINRAYTPKQEKTSTHRSSSGTSHGGRGGSF